MSLSGLVYLVQLRLPRQLSRIHPDKDLLFRRRRPNGQPTSQDPVWDRPPRNSPGDGLDLGERASRRPYPLAPERQQKGVPGWNQASELHLGHMPCVSVIML